MGNILSEKNKIFESFIDDCVNGNDNDYETGYKLINRFDEIERGDSDLYSVNSREEWYSIKSYIKLKGGEVIYISYGYEWVFKLEGDDLIISFVIPEGFYD